MASGVRKGEKEFHNKWMFQWFRTLGHGRHTSFQLPLREKQTKARVDPCQTDTAETSKVRLFCDRVVFRYRKHNNKLLFAWNLLALSCLSPTGEPAVKTLVLASMSGLILVSETMPRFTNKAVDERHKKFKSFDLSFPEGTIMFSLPSPRIKSHFILKK